MTYILNTDQIYISKANGEREPFDKEKLLKSLMNSGADKHAASVVQGEITKILYDGIPTHKLYKQAFRLLQSYSTKTAANYKLRKAIMELGPSGYPFELFIAELLRRLGYSTLTGTIIKGRCVSHEIDVIAEKEDQHYMIECKFHNRNGNKCEVKIPLYIQSRFKDVEYAWRQQPGHENKHHQGWVVTNTRFTEDAITYAECVGLKLLSWDYPYDKGLKDLINRVNLHPITSLCTLTKKQKQSLLHKGVIFCRQICEEPNSLDTLDIDQRKKSLVLIEANDICNSLDIKNY